MSTGVQIEPIVATPKELSLEERLVTFVAAEVPDAKHISPALATAVAALPLSRTVSFTMADKNDCKNDH
jgi:hypothetical protein